MPFSFRDFTTSLDEKGEKNAFDLGNYFSYLANIFQTVVTIYKEF